MDSLVCYCFGYTSEDIKKDLLANGRSLIMEKITEEKKSSGCDCAAKNPKGTWCLPDVRRVVDMVKSQTNVWGTARWCRVRSWLPAHFNV